VRSLPKAVKGRAKKRASEERITLALASTKSTAIREIIASRTSGFSVRKVTARSRHIEAATADDARVV